MEQSKDDLAECESAPAIDAESQKQLMILAARNIIEGKVAFFPEVLKLWGCACYLGIQESYPVSPAIAFAVSASDDLALDDDFRRLCSESFLNKKDLQAIELEAFYRDQVRAACLELIVQFSRTD